MPPIRRIAAASVVAAALPAIGFAIAAPPPAPAAAALAPAGKIEPEAMAAMDRVSAALNAMQTLSLSADVTTEQVLETGQKLQYGGTIEIQARRPDRLKLVATADGQAREFYYDGKSLTIVAPRLKYYASVPAPPTMGLMLDKAKTQYDIELPLADLFAWGSNQLMRTRVREAYVVRPEMIGGRSCMHYAFRQEFVDWQIWIEEASTARPCKLVITTTADPAQPQYVAVLNWRDPAPIDPATFTYVPAGDVHKIAIADATLGDDQ